MNAGRDDNKSVRTTSFHNRSGDARSEEHTSELQSRSDLVCRLLLEIKYQTRAPGSMQLERLPKSGSRLFRISRPAMMASSDFAPERSNSSAAAVAVAKQSRED